MNAYCANASQSVQIFSAIVSLWLFFLHPSMNLSFSEAMSDEPSDLAQTVVADWIEDAASALAHAILNTATVIEFDFAVIDSSLPAPTVRRLIEATSLRMADFPSFGRSMPAIRAGHIGRPAAAQGAAQLRMYRRFYSRELAHMDDS